MAPQQESLLSDAHAGAECFDQCLYMLTLHSDPLKEMSLSVLSGQISRLKKNRASPFVAVSTAATAAVKCHRSLCVRGDSAPPPALTAIINSHLHIAKRIPLSPASPPPSLQREALPHSN